MHNLHHTEIDGVIRFHPCFLTTSFEVIHIATVMRNVGGKRY